MFGGLVWDVLGYMHKLKLFTLSSPATNHRLEEQNQSHSCQFLGVEKSDGCAYSILLWMSFSRLDATIIQSSTSSTINDPFISNGSKWNRGTPGSSMFMGFSLINHPAIGGAPMAMETPGPSVGPH